PSASPCTTSRTRSCASAGSRRTASTRQSTWQIRILAGTRNSHAIRAWEVFTDDFFTATAWASTSRSPSIGPSGLSAHFHFRGLLEQNGASPGSSGRGPVRQEEAHERHWPRRFRQDASNHPHLA